MIQVRSNSNFDVKCATIQFCNNNYNSQFDRWIRLKLYVESLDMSNRGLKFQANQSWGSHYNMGQQRLYEFCYLLHFDSQTSYLARILFLQGYGSLFWEFPSFTRIWKLVLGISQLYKDLQWATIQFPSVERIHKCFKILFLQGLPIHHSYNNEIRLQN